MKSIFSSLVRRAFTGTSPATRAVQGLASALMAMGVITAGSASAATFVSSELALSVDVSASVNSTEFNLQRDGYEAAFRDAGLIGQIESLTGGIAASLQYWSDSATQSTAWFHITDATSSNLFADAIAAAARPSSSSIGFGTNIADGIDFAANSLLTNAFDGKRLIIDVSGDGRQNRDCGGNCIGRLQTSRDNALAQGIAINGLPILTDRPNLDNYFASNVVGGPDSFLVAANDFDAFAQAVKTKIGREIAPPQSVPEPGMLIGLAAVSLLGFGAKKRQKDLT